MLKNEFGIVAQAGRAKVDYMKRDTAGFFVASMLAGMFIALGGFLSMTTGGLLADTAACKPMLSLTFAAALSLVIMAGCELFTGNNMTLTASLLDGKVQPAEALKLWGLCWLGNLAGSWVMVLLYVFSGACTQPIASFIAGVAAAKAALPPVQMVLRGLLCNICVCLAVWCGMKLKSESGKLIMVVWCILIFMMCGFEHSIANMSSMGVALVQGNVALPGYVLNLVLVSVGNFIGGAGFVAVPYWFLQRGDD